LAGAALIHQPTGEPTCPATQTRSGAMGGTRQGSEIITDRPEECREAAQLVIDT
jgi:hypothetical protein